MVISIYNPSAEEIRRIYSQGSLESQNLGNESQSLSNLIFYIRFFLDS